MAGAGASGPGLTEGGFHFAFAEDANPGTHSRFFVFTGGQFHGGFGLVHERQGVGCGDNQG